MYESRINYFTLWFVLLFGSCYAQESDYAVELDSTMNKFAPTGIRIGVDLAGPIYSFIEPTRTSYEVAADIDFHKFFAVVEAGYGSYNASDTSAYTSTGLFYRAGLDVNFISKDSYLNVFFFGLRYATSSFNETLKGDLPSSGWGTQAIDFEQKNSRANWVEMNMGMRVRIWKSLFAGYTIRLKFAKHNSFSEAQFQPYFIPGYGLAELTSNWSFNYYIQYRIEWKKKPIKWRSTK